MAADAWPSDVLVKRFFITKTGWLVSAYVLLQSPVNNIQSLCECNDFVFLQEHWLLPSELDILNNIYLNFLGVAHSAVDLTSDILVGRQYGWTAWLSIYTL